MSGTGPNPAKTYDEYLGPAMFQPLAKFVIDRAAPKVGERVLDLACGTGIVALQVAPLVGERGSVMGVDTSSPMIAVAKAKTKPSGAPVEWRTGNGTALEIDSAAFDLLICQQGLQFFTDRAAGAREMHRVVAPAGRAVIAVWKSIDHQGAFQPLVAAQAKALDIPVEKAGQPFGWGDPEALRMELLTAGFTKVDVFEHTFTATFAEADHFIERMTIAAASVMPQFAKVDLAPMIATATTELTPLLAQYREGDTLSFPMTSNIAIAQR